jgi:serine protease SohB
MQFLADYGLFLAKSVTLVIAILIIIGGIIALVSKGRNRDKEQLEIRKLNQRYDDMKKALESEMLTKAELKEIKKTEKKADKKETKKHKKRIFVIDFDGDMRASAVTSFREEITAILNIATPKDEVAIRLESPGGMVSAYGLAASQIHRIREKKIPITILIDKVAASGGYLMACTANRILAAPFAIIGSIGVLAQIPNFHRLLKKNDIDFEQITAGEYKRTVTMFGENTDRDREKLKTDLESIHHQFKDFIAQNRPSVDINQVATGEYWLATRAKELNLVDDLMTSDEYLLTASHDADLYQVIYTIKKSLSEKLSTAIQMAIDKTLSAKFI